MPNSPYLKISLLAALLITMLMCSLTIFAQEPPSVPERPKIFKPKVEEMIGIREEMPLFPGCDDRASYAAQKKCADSLLIAFIYSNLRYPNEAWQDSVQGMAVVSFVVEKDGTVIDAKLERDPGAGTGAEALRLVNLMAETFPRWTPGRQAGKDVRVQFNLPVKFKMADNKSPVHPPKPPKTASSIYTTPLSCHLLT